jgi:hypothetical protein
LDSVRPGRARMLKNTGPLPGQAEVVDRGDVRVGELTGDLRLVQEPAHVLGVRPEGRLDRHPSRRSRRSWALRTTPMPPRPSTSPSSYRPSSSLGLASRSPNHRSASPPTLQSPDDAGVCGGEGGIVGAVPRHACMLPREGGATGGWRCRRPELSSGGEPAFVRGGGEGDREADRLSPIELHDERAPGRSAERLVPLERERRVDRRVERVPGVPTVGGAPRRRRRPPRPPGPRSPPAAERSAERGGGHPPPRREPHPRRRPPPPQRTANT